MFQPILRCELPQSLKFIFMYLFICILSFVFGKDLCTNKTIYIYIYRLICVSIYKINTVHQLEMCARVCVVAHVLFLLVRLSVFVLTNVKRGIRTKVKIHQQGSSSLLDSSSKLFASRRFLFRLHTHVKGGEVVVNAAAGYRG